MTAEAARKTQLRKAQAMEAAEKSQKRGSGLQKLGSAVCRMPVRFRLDTAAAADPALIIARANTCHVGSRSAAILLLHGNAQHLLGSKCSSSTGRAKKKVIVL